MQLDQRIKASQAPDVGGLMLDSGAAPTVPPGGTPRHITVVDTPIREAPSSSAAPMPDAVTAEMAERTVRAMCQGDQAALAELYDGTVSRVYSLALRMLRNPADAEEITCDTYTQAWASAMRFDPTRGTVLAWLLTICRSRALDRLRQQRTAASQTGIDALEDVPDESRQPEELLALLQEGTRVHRAMAELPAVAQQLVGLAFLQGLSHQEITEATGIPLGTVKSHIRRALARLRESLD